MKYFILSLISFSIFSSTIFSQERKIAEFGKPTTQDFDLKRYEKDTTAIAVVLYEQGYNTCEIVNDHVILAKYVHKKIKIFNAQKFGSATVDVPLLTSGSSTEIVTNFKAVTHNDNLKVFAAKDAVFITREPGVGKVCRIIFPNVKDGSIIEYVYRIQSPFFYNFKGWEFQDEYPKIYSEFFSKMPGNYRYRKVLYGEKKVDIEDSYIDKNCLKLPYHYSNPDCVVSIYAMFDVPAFKTEGYMLSESNYIARVDFEPKEFISINNGRTVFSTDWDDVDKSIRKGDYIGNQLNKSGYFKRNMPDSILSIGDQLQKARAVYTFIQDHFTWDGTFYNSETQVKDAFDVKKGSVPEINLSLINALNAANLDAKLVLLSTRENGLPTQDYPVMTKFNYTIAQLTIGSEKYLLDATDKKAPFGIIPFRTLNVQGRVMDFKKGSYWEAIIPFQKNIHFANAQLTADKNGDFTGKVSVANYGYMALEKRDQIEETKEEDYIKIKTSSDSSIEISTYQIENLTTINEPLKENYTVFIQPEIAGEKVILYPFFIETYFANNPFTLENRSYPLDFGFPFTNTYVISINLEDFYTVQSMPESRIYKLPENSGELSVAYTYEDSKINIRFNFKLNDYRFKPEAYQSLKEIFGSMITILKNEPITLKRN